MVRFHWLYALAFTLLISTSGAALLLPFGANAQQAMRVTFLNPGFASADNPTGGFWNSVSAFTQAVADDLQIELEILYSNRDHLLMYEQLNHVLSRKQKPDYLLLVSEKGMAKQMLPKIQAANVKAMTILNSVIDDDNANAGTPRTRYTHWIGELVPDNHSAGYAIAAHLIEDALAKKLVNENGKLQIAAINGDQITPAAREREAGLHAAVNEHKQAELKQVLYGYWSKEKAQKLTKVIMSRYPNTHIIWAANDPMALGALSQLKASNKHPGKAILIGGLNWDNDAIEALKSEEMQVSVGGHFMTAGWALIALFDYHHGIDFMDETWTHKQTIFSELDSNNLTQFTDCFAQRDWEKIDFSKFSRVRNPALTRYHFNLSFLLKQTHCN